MECCYDFEIGGVKGHLDRHGYYNCKLTNRLIVYCCNTYFYIPTSIFIRLESTRDFRIFEDYGRHILGCAAYSERIIEKMPVSDYIINNARVYPKIKDNYLVMTKESVADKEIVNGIVVKRDKYELIEDDGAVAKKLSRKNKVYRKLRTYNFEKMKGETDYEYPF